MAVEIDKRNKMLVLALGGNLGNVKQTFNSSIKALKEKLGEFISQSSIYQTKAWGVENQPDFLNQVIIIDTALSPKEVLSSCLAIEKQEGRERDGIGKWHERIIDIDILFYQEEIVATADLQIPHPYLHQRNFVLFPLAEIIPDFIHPILGKTVLELKKNCTDKLQVIKTLD